MTNSDNGWSLQEELLQAIAQVYAWPELPAQKNSESKAVEGAARDAYVGEYELQTNLLLTISSTDDHLFLRMPGQLPVKLVRQSDGVYSLAHMDDMITFVRNGQGNVQALLLRHDGVETVAMRRGYGG